MHSSLGSRLREHRERKAVTLAAIAEDTKISIALLEGLERDDVSRWPGGLFRRAYIRSYARAIGLEPEAVVREFVALHPDPIEESLAQAASQAKASEDGPTTRLAFLRAGLAKFQAETAIDAGTRQVPTLERDLHSMAALCTALGQAADQDAVIAVLADASRLLNARGMIVWVWDAVRCALCPAIAHGYPASMLQQLAALARERETAIGAAFHTAQLRVVTGAGHGTGAVVTPLLTPAGCVGVLAIEFPNGAEQRENVRAFATMLGAQLSMLLPLSVPTAAAATA
jgi:transcriptional regulator with XRE-family HTH domain